MSAQHDAEWGYLMRLDGVCRPPQRGRHRPHRR